MCATKSASYKLELFDWDKERRTLTIEASQLEGAKRPGLNPPAGMHTLIIYNPDTGNSVRFGQIDVVQDDEGDIQAWHYDSTSGGSHVPDKPIRLTVFND